MIIVSSCHRIACVGYGNPCCIAVHFLKGWMLARGDPPVCPCPSASICAVLEPLSLQHATHGPMAPPAQAARKVYETALASLAARPASAGRHAALLALPFADLEAAGDGSDAALRALHVLTWLGLGGPYAAFRARPDVAASSFHDRSLTPDSCLRMLFTAALCQLQCYTTCRIGCTCNYTAGCMMLQVSVFKCSAHSL